MAGIKYFSEIPRPDGTPPPNKYDEPPPNDYGQQTAAAQDEAEFLMQYMGLTEYVRKLIGHNFTDFVKSCTFRGSTCLDSKYEFRQNIQTSIYPRICL